MKKQINKNFKASNFKTITLTMLFIAAVISPIFSNEIITADSSFFASPGHILRPSLRQGSRTIYSYIIVRSRFMPAIAKKGKTDPKHN